MAAKSAKDLKKMEKAMADGKNPDNEETSGDEKEWTYLVSQDKDEGLDMASYEPTGFDGLNVGEI